MTPTTEHAVLFASNSLAASIIVKATIAVSIALIAARFARRSRASIRHAVLAAGFAVLFALPIAAITAPPIHIALPMTQRQSDLTSDTQQSVAEMPLATQASKNPGTFPMRPLASEISLLDLLSAIWAIGAALFLAPVITGLWQVRSLRRTALPWPTGNSVAATLASDASLRRRVEVLLHESVAGPMTCGVVRPAILLSRNAETWSDEDLSRAIAHELEHVRRADWLTHCFARIACSLYWFHPLVWIAWRKLTLEAERVCDDAVIVRSEPTAYAEQLLALARRLSTASKPALLAMASRSNLSARVNSVLNPRQRRGRAGLCAVAVACGVAALVIITLSPIQLIAAEPRGQDQRTSGAALPSFEVASIKRDPSSCGGCAIRFDGGDPGRYTATNVTARWLIQLAYNVKDFQISGGPSWIGSVGFDIDAKIDDTTANQLRRLHYDEQQTQKGLMLQSLLADRFNLKITRGTKAMPAYAIVVAKGGPKITEVPPPPPPGASPAPASAPARGSDGLLVLQPGQRDMSGTRNGGRTIRGDAVPLSQLASMLSFALAQPVLDQTGLKGTYDFRLEFALETGTGGAPLPPEQAATDAETSPSLFSAIQEQLGLRLESTKAPVETIVIDQIEEPSLN